MPRLTYSVFNGNEYETDCVVSCSPDGTYSFQGHDGLGPKLLDEIEKIKSTLPDATPVDVLRELARRENRSTWVDVTVQD
jgi:hypothetical protein